MFYLKDKEELYQWDSEQVIYLEDESIVEVHFANKTMNYALVCEVHSENGEHFAKIPNILLQSPYNLFVYAFTNCGTTESKTIIVNKRPRPENYIYKETEKYEIHAIIEEELKKAKDSGEFDGESAYEVAVRNGFIGTEEEWLASLVGADGKTPYIRDSYWWIGNINTGVKAEGEDALSGYDFVIQTETELNALNTLYGRVLIKLGQISYSHAIDLTSSSVKLIEFAGDLIIDARVQFILNARLSNPIELRGKHFILTAFDYDNWEPAGCYVEFSGFYGITNLFMAGMDDYFSFKLNNCWYISNCVVGGMNKCHHIDNCTIKGHSGFKDCYYINNVEVDYSDVENCHYINNLKCGTNIRNCSHISNTFCNGNYENCSFVDAETCQGFVPTEDIGKVQTLTTDGSYSTKAILEAPTSAQSFETIPVVTRNTSGANTAISYKIVSEGGSSKYGIPQRMKHGGLRGDFQEDFSQLTEVEKNQQLVNYEYLNKRLAGIGGGGEGGGKTIYRHLIEVRRSYEIDYSNQGVFHLLLYLSDATPITTYEQILALKSKIGEETMSCSFVRSYWDYYDKYDSPETQSIILSVNLSSNYIFLKYLLYDLSSGISTAEWSDLDNITITDTVTEV